MTFKKDPGKGLESSFSDQEVTSSHPTAHAYEMPSVEISALETPPLSEEEVGAKIGVIVDSLSNGFFGSLSPEDTQEVEVYLRRKEKELGKQVKSIQDTVKERVLGIVINELTGLRYSEDDFLALEQRESIFNLWILSIRKTIQWVFKDEMEVVHTELYGYDGLMPHLINLQSDRGRGLFERRVSHLMDLAIEREVPVQVVFSDLNNFKLINDHYSHQVGDMALKRINEAIEFADINLEYVSIRRSGDEIIFVMLGDRGRVVLELNKIKKAIEGLPLLFFKGSNEPIDHGRYNQILKEWEVIRENGMNRGSEVTVRSPEGEEFTLVKIDLSSTFGVSPLSDFSAQGILNAAEASDRLVNTGKKVKKGQIYTQLSPFDEDSQVKQIGTQDLTGYKGGHPTYASLDGLPDAVSLSDLNIPKQRLRRLVEGLRKKIGDFLVNLGKKVKNENRS